MSAILSSPDRSSPNTPSTPNTDDIKALSAAFKQYLSYVDNEKLTECPSTALITACYTQLSSGKNEEKELAESLVNIKTALNSEHDFSAALYKITETILFHIAQLQCHVKQPRNIARQTMRSPKPTAPTSPLLFRKPSSPGENANAHRKSSTSLYAALNRRGSDQSYETYMRSHSSNSSAGEQISSPSSISSRSSASSYDGNSPFMSPASSPGLSPCSNISDPAFLALLPTSTASADGKKESKGVKGPGS